MSAEGAPLRVVGARAPNSRPVVTGFAIRPGSFKPAATGPTVPLTLPEAVATGTRLEATASEDALGRAV